MIVGSLDFFSIKYFFLFENNIVNSLDLVFIMSCLVISFLFKLSAFPCHMWTPDVYEGVWTPITAFFAIVVKTVLISFCMRIFCYIFDSIDVWQFLFLASGCGSIIIGCFGAILQKRIKRFLAYTSINQIGFLILGIATNNINGLSSSIMFLFIYVIMSIIFFGILLNIKHFTKNFQIIFLTDLYSINSTEFDMNSFWVLTLFSMAGIPPLAGFFIKYYIILNLINLSFYWLTIIILFFSTISSYYYLNFIKYILFEKKSLKNLYFFDIKFSSEINLILFICIFIVTFFTLIIYYMHSQLLLLSFSCKYILQ